MIIKCQGQETVLSSLTNNIILIIGLTFVVGLLQPVIYF